MNNSRDGILKRIRASLHRDEPLAGPVRDALEARLSAGGSHVQPAWDEEPLARFARKLTAAGGTVSRVDSMQAAADALTEHLRRHNLPKRAVVGDDQLLGTIPWPADLALEQRAATGDDMVSVTTALAAVAETGTLALCSGPASPTTLNFLPDDHIVIIRGDQVVGHLEEIWATLRATGGDVPRTVNLISGPSKTADVEQTLQQGAHGPRRLHVIVIE